MQRQFTSNDVIALTGITARQLQWWDERGIVAPVRQGHRRIYSWDELVTVAVIRQLRRRGFSLQRMRKAGHTVKAISTTGPGSAAEIAKRCIEH